MKTIDIKNPFTVENLALVMGLLILSLSLMLGAQAVVQKPPKGPCKLHQEPQTEDIYGNKQDDQPDSLVGPYEAIMAYYNWALKSITPKLKPLPNQFPLIQGQFISYKPKKVLVWKPSHFQTGTQTLSPILLSVGLLGGEFQPQYQETGIYAIQVSQGYQPMLLVLIASLPKSNQANLSWDNYLAIDLYQNAGINQYQVISISHGRDLDIVIGSLLGQLGYGGTWDLKKIWGSDPYKANSYERFYGKFEQVQLYMR